MNPKVATILTTLSKNFIELRDALFPPTLGMNMAAVVDWNTEIVFADLMKQSRQWTSNQQGKPYNAGPPLDLDRNNYPKSLAAPDCFVDSLMLVDNLGTHIPNGPYVLTFDGAGLIKFNGRASMECSTSGTMVNINPSGAPFLALQIWKTDPTNPIRNIKLIPYGLDNQLFHPSLINRYKGQYQVVRLMDWMNINDTNNPQINWTDRAYPDDRSYALGKGVPLEIAIEFCNTIGSDPWFCIPHRSSDDYVKNFCSMINDKLHADRKVYIEYTNEAWNTIMVQANWCQTQGVALKLANDLYEAQIRFYAKRANEVHKVAQSQLGSRLIRVISAFHKDVRVGIWALDQIKNDCDAIAIAPYWGHGDQLGDLETVTLDDIFAKCNSLIDQNKAFTTNYKAIADNAKIKLFAYEGGQHMVKPDGSSNVIDKLCQANRDPRIKDLYLKDLKNWKDVGGDLFMAFASMCLSGRFGSWGILEYFDQVTSPKLEALKQYAGLTG